MTGKAVRVGIISMVAVAGLGFAAMRMRSTVQPKAAAARQVAVQRGDLTIKVSETGTLDPVVKVDVKSRVAGRLQRIFVQPGKRVAAGDPIAIIDPTEVSREVAGVRAQLAASQATLAQAQENFALTRRQTALAIRRAAVNYRNALAGLREAEVNLKDAQVGVRQAQTRLTQTAAPTRPQEVEQAEASIQRIVAQIADARRTASRRQALVEKGFLSQQEADTAQTQVTLAEADLASAKERLALLKEGPRQEDIATIQVGVDAARVRVEQARVRLSQARIAVDTARVQVDTERANAAQVLLRQRDIDRTRADVAQSTNRLAQQSVQLAETRIVAPIAGEVTGKYLEEGELVASATAGFAQGAALVTIADLTRMQVKVNVNEVDVPRLSMSHPVEIRVDGIPERVFRGRIASIAPASIASTQPGTSSNSAAANASTVVRFEVKVSVLDIDPRLRPGMTAEVDIILNRRKNALLLPAEALRPGDKAVVVSGKGEKTVRTERTVKIGLRDDARVEILDGLKEGDRIEVAKVEAKDRRKINIEGPPGD